jgi:hypothetical protein
MKLSASRLAQIRQLIRRARAADWNGQSLPCEEIEAMLDEIAEARRGPLAGQPTFDEGTKKR